MTQRKRPFFGKKVKTDKGNLLQFVRINQHDYIRLIIRAENEPWKAGTYMIPVDKINQALEDQWDADNAERNLRFVKNVWNK